MRAIQKFRSLAAGLVLSAVLGSSSTSVAAASAAVEIAIFAGGCFWCVESDFDAVPGVVETISGYTGGRTSNPTYQQVGHGDTGHREAVEIKFDPSRISYAQMLEIFWRSVDPTDDQGQFCDRGYSYTTAIYTTTDEQERLANESKQKLVASGRLQSAIVTPVERASPFYPAEDYHQNYYNVSPFRYRFYRYSCGRDARVEELWGAEAHKGIPKH